MSHLTTVKLQIKEKEILINALKALDFTVASEDNDVIVKMKSTRVEDELEEAIAFRFNEDNQQYQAEYDKWELNSFGVGEYWKEFDHYKSLKPIQKEYTKQLVMREAERLTPEYGEYVLTEENEGQFKLNFPQMQSATVGV